MLLSSDWGGLGWLVGLDDVITTDYHIIKQLLTDCVRSKPRTMPVTGGLIREQLAQTAASQHQQFRSYNRAATILLERAIWWERTLDYLFLPQLDDKVLVLIQSYNAVTFAIPLHHHFEVKVLSAVLREISIVQKQELFSFLHSKEAFPSFPSQILVCQSSEVCGWKLKLMWRKERCAPLLHGKSRLQPLTLSIEPHSLIMPEVVEARQRKSRNALGRRRRHHSG